jgi:SAM-dependent methyltransferase
MNQILVRTLGVTLFLSAFLLFWCQPMVGKMVLPYLGGAAAVWTTCVLFFQATLLVGYIYAHLLGRLPSVQLQIGIHLVLLLLPLFFLPLNFTTGMGESAFAHPAIALIRKLLTTVGLPFFVISTTAPLLQNWLTRTEDASGKDPYFLYSASNAGSLLALLIYPFLVEPQIGVTAQSRVWTTGYLILMAMIAISAGMVWRTAGLRRKARTTKPAPVTAGPAMKTRMYWIVPAFIASGLMLAVTNHITSNLAAAPFLWILPLAIYLLTFIVAFAPRLNIGSDRVSRLLPIILLAVFPVVCADVIAPPGLNWALIALHLALLYAGALLCHARLAESRPDSRHLTEFYFWVALGGVLGGIFTATLSPIVFNTVLEYPLLVAALSFFRSSPDKTYKMNDADWNYPALVAAGITAVWLIFRYTNIDLDVSVPALAHTALLFTAYKFRSRPVRFALTLTIMMLAYNITLPQYIEGAERIHVERDFFGVKKVLRSGSFRTLLHGDTTHGVENLDSPGMPISYYHPSGTMGQIMNGLGRPLNRVAVLGLGTGTMAGYTAEGRQMTFFEIDPQVESIAREYFSFLPKCGQACNVIIGDGRLELQRLPDQSFDMLMMDAFSSDAIPAHLLSREAIQMYLTKLAPDGLLLIHVSNRYLNVQILAEQLLLDAGLVTFQRNDLPGEFAKEGKTATNHVIAARRIEDLGHIPALDGWVSVTRTPGIRVWTDDYSSLLELVRWH